MKRMTMELGGHAPAIVFDDADLDVAVRILSGSKFRNAGQVCVAPTRFLVQENVYSRFLAGFVKAAEAIKVGNGLDAEVTMGPLANGRRVEAMEALTADAISHGGKIATGGERIGTGGNFYKPTVLTDVPLDARVLNEEPFGPIAVVSAFSTYESAISEANRLPYGLAAYAYTTSAKTSAALGRGCTKRNGFDQSSWPGAAGVAVWRHKRLRLWIRRRDGGDGKLPQRQAGHGIRLTVV
jgi:succinate-semialdehyde dehydrogenase/glutarate-semialdehyde dehydrogenase